MLGPRRIGKTWLMDKLRADLSAEGWVTVPIDVVGATQATLLAGLQKTSPSLGPREGMDLLTALHNAGILDVTDDCRRIRSGLLRCYWLRYHPE